MIVDMLLQILMVVLSFILKLVPWPTVHCPDDMFNIIKFVMNLNTLLPIYEMLDSAFLICGIVVCFNMLKWTIKLVDWVMDVIP